MQSYYKFAALFLLDLINVIDCQWQCRISAGNGGITQSETDLDLSLKFTSDATPLRSNTMYSSCNFKIEKTSKTAEIALKCAKLAELCPIVSVQTTISEWSSWTDCVISNGTGMTYRFKNIACEDDRSTCCPPTNLCLINKQECMPNTGNWSKWSNWSECSFSGEQYRYRSLLCPLSNSVCLLPSNGSSFERKNCTPNLVSSAQEIRQENIKDDEKRYTITVIILVAFGCLLLGVLLTALLFFLYMKRTQQGCFSKIVKEAQGDSKRVKDSQVESKRQNGPDLKFLAENVVVKKYDPKNHESADMKNENKSDESQYQFLSSNRIDNDQETYDELQLKETRFDQHGNESSYDRLKQTDNDEQTDTMTILPHETEGVSEYSRDSDIGEHNYFILESENISRESKASNLGCPETHAEVSDEVRDSTLGTEDEQPDAAHEYFVLEHVENGHNQD